MIKNRLFIALSYCLFFNTLDGRASVLIDTMYHDGNILNLIKKIIPEKPTIIEGGGFQEAITIQMKDTWPDAIIYTFEPLWSFFPELKSNKPLSNVFHFPIALSNITGNNLYYYCENHKQASSILKPISQHLAHFIFASNPKTVDGITIDEFTRRNQIPTVDLLWLDTEGSEFLILQASPRVLEQVKAIFMKVHFKEFRERNTLYNHTITFLKTKGFKEIWKNLNSSFQGSLLLMKV